MSEGTACAKTPELGGVWSEADGSCGVVWDLSKPLILVKEFAS